MNSKIDGPFYQHFQGAVFCFLGLFLNLLVLQANLFIFLHFFSPIQGFSVVSFFHSSLLYQNVNYDVS